MEAHKESNAEDEKIIKSAPEQPSNQNYDKLVQTAVQFLQNPKVASRPLVQKQQFLKTKGLTDKQVEDAVRLSGSLDYHQPIFPPPPTNLQPVPIPFWIRLRDTSLAIIIVSSAGYGLYKLYLKYIKPYLFDEKQESETDKTIKLLMDTMQTNQETLNTMQEKLKELTAMAQANQNTQKFKDMERYQELKEEIKSIKGLMLNRRSFPPPPNLSNGLPSWQMQQVTDVNNDNVLTDELKDESDENLQDNLSQNI